MPTELSAELQEKHLDHQLRSYAACDLSFGSPLTALGIRIASHYLTDLKDAADADAKNRKLLAAIRVIKKIGYDPYFWLAELGATLQERFWAIGVQHIEELATQEIAGVIETKLSAARVAFEAAAMNFDAVLINLGISAEEIYRRIGNLYLHEMEKATTADQKLAKYAKAIPAIHKSDLSLDRVLYNRGMSKQGVSFDIGILYLLEIAAVPSATRKEQIIQKAINVFENAGINPETAFKKIQFAPREFFFEIAGMHLCAMKAQSRPLLKYTLAHHVFNALKRGGIELNIGLAQLGTTLREINWSVGCSFLDDIKTRLPGVDRQAALVQATKTFIDAGIAMTEVWSVLGTTPEQILSEPRKIGHARRPDFGITQLTTERSINGMTG